VPAAIPENDVGTVPPSEETFKYVWLFCTEGILAGTTTVGKKVGKTVAPSVGVATGLHVGAETRIVGIDVKAVGEL
jgi:hypothetical protein